MQLSANACQAGLSMPRGAVHKRKAVIARAEPKQGQTRKPSDIPPPADHGAKPTDEKHKVPLKWCLRRTFTSEWHHESFIMVTFKVRNGRFKSARPNTDQDMPYVVLVY